MLKRIPYVQGLVWLFLLFVVPLPLIQALALGLPAGDASEALAIQWGSIAYVWFLVAIYLSTRPHWLDRLIGLPNVYMIHGMLSMLAIGLAYLHKTGTQSFGLIKQTGDWAFDLFVGLMLYSLVFMAGWLTNRVRPLAQLKSWLEGIFHHELSVWLHRLNLLAVALVFVHVQLISYITSITSYIWLFNGYTILILGCYGWSKVQQSWRLPKGKLIASRPLQPNFYELTLQLRHPQAVTIRPGDYIFVNFPHNDGLKELHPFSVVNQVGAQGEVVLAIRGDGDFTRKVQTLRQGTPVTITNGYGRFDSIIREHPEAPLVLIAGGSGIVPMLALIAAYPQRPITLFATAHRSADLIYTQTLTELAAKRETLTLHLQGGRFDVAQEASQIAAPETVYLISGPQSLGHAWQRELRHQGVSATQIYYEEFSW